MKNTATALVLASLLFHSSFTPLSVGVEQQKEGDDVVLEIMTVEIMVEQLEKMPRATEDERNAWAQLFLDIMQRFGGVITYETRDNLNLWKLVGRWATAQGILEKSPYADEPFFHIQRLRPDYQKDKELMRLMAKLNAIRNEEYEESIEERYRSFVGNFDLFEEWGTEGNGYILYRIGREYRKGHGLWRNETEAVKWFNRAAAAGNVDAIGELGRTYLSGKEKDVEKGLKLLNEAVKKGSKNAAYTLGQYYVPSKSSKGDRKKAIEMLLVAANRGHSVAFRALARQYIEVGNGTEALRWANGDDEQEPDPNDRSKHLLWEINRRITDNDGDCTYIKGKVYALGIGEIEQDLTRAKALFLKSFRQDDSRAFGAEALSAMYEEGIGVEADRILAGEWRNKARKGWGWPDRFTDRRIEDFAKKLREASAAR